MYSAWLHFCSCFVYSTLYWIVCPFLIKIYSQIFIMLTSGYNSVVFCISVASSPINENCVLFTFIIPIFRILPSVFVTCIRCLCRLHILGTWSSANRRVGIKTRVIVILDSHSMWREAPSVGWTKVSKSAACWIGWGKGPISSARRAARIGVAALKLWSTNTKPLSVPSLTTRSSNSLL